jgi:uncharacterized NAD-dependent epimerase/dehydratase family protein
MTRQQAIVYADQLYSCADGKTAHGLVRYSRRFDICCVVDSTLKEEDAGILLDGIKRNIPLYTSLEKAYTQTKPDTFIVGAVSEGGVLPQGYDKAVTWALTKGLNVVSGLHQFLSDDPTFSSLAQHHGCTITDPRKIFRDYKRFYTGKINTVQSKRIALIGTDSAIGKRTLAVLLNEELKKRGRSTDMIYTGQTGWMQGWPHGIILDAMINDFISGGLEGVILDSWKDSHPEFMIIEGQGSLVHPFFPGGFEILTAGSVHGFIVVDAPGRPHLDGFPGYPMPEPSRVVTIAQLLTEKSLLGIGINREKLTPIDCEKHKRQLHQRFNVPVVEPLHDGVSPLIDVLEDLCES